MLCGELVGARGGARRKMRKQQPKHGRGEPLRELGKARGQAVTEVLAGQQREQSIVASLRGRVEVVPLAVAGVVHGCDHTSVYRSTYRYLLLR